MPFGSTMLTAHKVIMVEFIQMYKSMAFLWDTRHPRYNDRLLRMKGYKKLLEKYQEIDDEATIPILKAKLDRLRNSYIRELKKVRATKELNPDAVHTPVLWYYNLLSFLEDHVLRKSSRGSAELAGTGADQNNSEFVYLDNSCDDEDDGSQSNDFIPAEYQDEDDDAQSCDSSSERPVKRHKIKVEPLDRESRGAERGGDWEVIGRAIGVQLKDLGACQAALAQKLIAETLFYAKMGRLAEGSAVTHI